MEIENIKINSYGNLKDKELELNKFNIIYGKNESGKSTLLNYIKNSFYGISKNKNGKDMSDYDKYLPWGENDFSGRLKYKLDDNNSYEIFRDFNKKNPIIYNSQKEDISEKFKIDKKTGNQFFYEQTKVDENTFMSTALSAQKEVVVDSSTQGILLQKVANLAESGAEDVSYKKAMSNINSRLLSEVGTSNSKERPINIAMDSVQKYIFDLTTKNSIKTNRYEIEEKINNYNEELEEENKKEELFNDISDLLINNKLEKEKIKIKNNVISENNEKIKLLDNKKDNLFNNIKNIDEITNEKNKINKKYIFILIILILLNILNFIFIKNIIINILIFLIIPIYLIILFSINNKNKKIIKAQIEKNNKIKSENDEIKKQMDILEGQIDILEKSTEETKNEIKNSEDKINEEFRMKKEEIIEKYESDFSDVYINNLFENNIDLLKNTNKRKINELEVQLHKIKLDKDNIDRELEDILSLEEKLEIEKENLENLEKRADEFNLAKEILDEAYDEMKKNITPKFNQSLSKNIDKISNGKYKNIVINENITVELDDGRYVPAETLSVGTIEQIYLSLRLSILDEISKEKLPIILDEAFAYYDDSRLEAALDFLSKVDNQVILFTCTNREKEILEKNNIEFNYISL